MKLYRKISGMFIIIILTTTLSAQDNSCNVKKTFPVKNGTALSLSNKYGDVNIITVKDDSLSVCATITIVQDNKNLVQKNIKLVTISVEKLKDTIHISTIYDNKFFSEANRQGRKSFNVDYLIKMPAYMDLNLKDEFGNVSVEELSGTFNVRLSNGNLTAKKLTKGIAKPVSSIFVDHGYVNIDESNWLTLTVLNCPSVIIGSAQALVITSAISKISISDISSLVCNSKSDIYRIMSINNIISQSTYSAFEIGNLNEQLNSNATYGSITISDMNKWFSTIDIVSGQSTISLKTGQNVSFKCDIIATDAFVDFPAEKYPGIIRTDNNQTTALRGLSGIEKGTKSLIKIMATGGKISIQ